MDASEYEITWKSDAGKLLRIVKLTQEIEFLACKFYSSLGNCSADKQMRDFWLKMAEEERDHMEFWKKVGALVEHDRVPQIFDDSDAVYTELLTTQNKIRELFNKSESLANNQNEALLASFRLEFYNIHSVLLPLLKFVKPILNCECPYDNYEKHLTCFIDAYKMHNGATSPEMQLLEEVMQRLWSDNVKLAKMSYVDELTGIFNRRGFANSALPLISLAQREVRPIAFMIADIDHFKSVNDRFGHQTGDQALVHVVEAMRSALRGADVIARYGGEEFIVLCPEVKDASTPMIAERVRKTVEASKFEACELTISIGAVDAIPPAGLSASDVISELCAHADTLLLKAKQEGRNKSEFQTHSFFKS